MNALNCLNVSKYFPVRRLNNSSNGWVRVWGLFPGKRERIPVVNSINCCVERGEIFGIIGPNGSGKSTLIRMISTLLVPDEGSIEIFGIDVVKRSLEVRRLINRVSVEAAFFKKLSAVENLMYATRLYGLPAKKASRHALEVLERLGFNGEKARESMEDLSRGMQQKVAITRALLTSPKLLLLDEPTTGLDPRSKREVQNFLGEVREEGVTILITSHDMEEIERISDRIAVIRKGRFVCVDSPSGLKSRSALGSEADLEDVFLKMTEEEMEGGFSP